MLPPEDPERVGHFLDAWCFNYDRHGSRIRIMPDEVPAATYKVSRWLHVCDTERSLADAFMVYVENSHCFPDGSAWGTLVLSSTAASTTNSNWNGSMAQQGWVTEDPFWFYYDVFYYPSMVPGDIRDMHTAVHCVSDGLPLASGWGLSRTRTCCSRTKFWASTVRASGTICVCS